MEIPFDALRKYLDRTRLGKTWRAFDKQMAITQQRDQHAINQVCLTDDQLARMCLELLKLFCDAH